MPGESSLTDDLLEDGRVVGILGRRKAKREIEAGTLPYFAFDPDSASMGFDDAPNDRQTKADSAHILVAGLPEPSEDMRDLITGYARTGVRDTHAQLPRKHFAADPDLSALRCE